MSTLYIKHRPQNFADVVGQESIVATIERSLKSGDTSHAYLFSGSRGTGKTTMARIVARALGAAPEDTHEIDAASYTGVDNIRELREAAFVLPMVSPKKVYIVDEVHMLSKAAANAFLKILEEPPAHVVFILATTEPHKLLDTILSRCQHFQFKRPSEETLASYATKVAADEGYTLEPEAAMLIAMLGDGAYRDTLTILQQVISAAKDKGIARTHVEQTTGAPRGELVHALVRAILARDLDTALAGVGEAARNHLDLKVFTKLVLRDLRLMLLMALSPSCKKGLQTELSKEHFAFLSEMGKQPVKILPDALRELLQAYEEMNSTPVQQLPLELAVVRLLGERSPGEVKK